MADRENFKDETSMRLYHAAIANTDGSFEEGDHYALNPDLALAAFMGRRKWAALKRITDLDNGTVWYVVSRGKSKDHTFVRVGRVFA